MQLNLQSSPMVLSGYARCIKGGDYLNTDTRVCLDIIFQLANDGTNASRLIIDHSTITRDGI